MEILHWKCIPAFKINAYCLFLQRALKKKKKTRQCFLALSSFLLLALWVGTSHCNFLEGGVGALSSLIKAHLWHRKTLKVCFHKAGSTNNCLGWSCPRSCSLVLADVYLVCWQQGRLSRSLCITSFQGMFLCVHVWDLRTVCVWWAVCSQKSLGYSNFFQRESNGKSWRRRCLEHTRIQDQVDHHLQKDTTKKSGKKEMGLTQKKKLCMNQNFHKGEA